ncbi:hypothetical protein [Nocardiopsis sp. YSL2]|uniref:hypothetical protein n=1 Tax=Nocardiopsis sp. YSL2 TaxID=2939492 RepID=UPI0026F47349|nr:hypothetical protein [Nocardiopsis sp. YSL2]
MSDTTTFTAKNRAVLESWARSMNAKVTQVAEDWRSITFQAEATDSEGTRVRCRFRQPIPRMAALRRLARTYVVGLVHDVDSAQCHHVRRVIPTGDTEVDARRSAILIASALVEIQRHHTCGATVSNLEPYVVERAVNWKP